MAIPTLITVHGTYLKANGSPEEGSVVFRSNISVYDQTTESVLAPDTLIAVLDGSGGFSIQVPSTNDPNWLPVNWTWKISVNLGESVTTFHSTIPYDAPGASVAISSLAPIPESAGSGPSGDLTDYIPKSVATAKGDVLVGSAASVVSKIPVGTNGQVLTANSATATGVSWSDAAASGVTSVNSRTGAVTLTSTDVGLGNANNTSDANKPVSTAQQTALDLKANLASPTFTGTPAAPTATAGTNTTQLATTAFVTTADNLKANLASPTFTGTPAAPTATAGTSTTQLATTAFVTTADNLKADLASPTFTGTPSLPTGTIGVTQTAGDSSTKLATTAFVTTADNLKANLASPTFTGTPAAPTATAGTNTTQLATTAFVTTADNLKADLASPTFTGTPSLPTGTTGVTQTAGDSTTKLATTAFVTTADNLKANLASPTFTGTPAAPTATLGTNTTQLATTAFVLANAASVNFASKIYNVLSYGADNTGATDSTTAFQNALNAAAPSTPGDAAYDSGAVYVPPGRYTVGALTIPHRVTLFGAHGRVSRLIFKASAGSRANMLSNAQNYSGSNDVQAVVIRDLVLDGNMGNNAGTWQCAIFLNNDTPSGTYEWVDGRHVVMNVFVENFTGDGIVQQGRGGSIIAFNQVFFVNGFGFNVDIDNYLIGNDAGAIGLDGFLMRGSNYLSGCKAWFCGASLTSSRYAGNNATATTVTPPSGNAWDGGSLTGGYVFSLANGWGNGFTWRDISGTSTAGNFNGGVGAGLSAQDCAGSGFWLEAGRITLHGIEADSNGNNGTSNGASNGTVVAAKAGVTLNWSYNCQITGTSWDRSANLAHQAAALAVLGSGTGCRVELGFEGILTDGTNAMPALLAGSDVTNNYVQLMCSGGGIYQPSFASSYTPDPFNAETHQMTLTGNITVNAPKMSGTLGGAGIYLVKGMILRLMFTQDATGGRTVTLNSVFRLNSKTFSTTANATTCIEFMYDGTNWQAMS